MVEQLSTDVVVVGAGAAGLMAALAARDAGADVLLLSKGPLGKAANTAMAAGILRQEAGLHHDSEALAQLESSVALLAPLNMNELRACNQIQNGLQILHCILEASLTRKESRGAFFRTDYPEQNDSQWCCNIYISLNNNGRLILERGALH